MNGLKARFYQYFSPDRPMVWMLVCIFLWIASLSGFLFGYNALSSDALSYYDHTKYFVENIKQGIFPLWDHFWQNGSPNDFFLRRIGCYNPLYLFMALVNLIGLPFRETYLFVHACYYFLGALGLFLLGREVWRDERPAFLVFALFLFSAIGTRIFDSYMCLMVVPLIWFLFFAVFFLSRPSRLGLAGLTLAFMILANTYIPLYVMTILIVAFLFWVLIFPKEAWAARGRAWGFFRQDWGLSLGMLFLVICSFLPPLLFFKQGSQEVIALPGRHSGGVTGNVLSVDKQFLDWGLIEDVFFSLYFTDLRRYILAIIFVPVLSLVLWGMGAFARLNRRIIFFITLGLFFVLLGTPRAFPLHEFLYQHIFYFKYFRNLHFFLWFLVIPLFIFTTGEFLNALLKVRFDNVSQKVRGLGVVMVVHLGFLIWIISSGNAIVTTVFCVMASCFLCVGYILSFFRKAWAFWLGIVILTAPQAFEVYHYASANMPRYTAGDEYGNLNKNFFFSSSSFSEGDWTKRNECGGLYYSAASMYELCEHVSSAAYETYLTNKLTTYGKVASFAHGGYGRLESVIRTNEDLALAHDWVGEDLGNAEGKKHFRRDTDELKLVHLNASGLRVDTSFKTQRFLVYNDSWDKDWRVYIDGKEARLYRANGGFKGVVVPSGKRQIYFQYGSLSWVAFNWFLLVAFNALFLFVLYLGVKKLKGERE